MIYDCMRDILIEFNWISTFDDNNIKTKKLDCETKKRLGDVHEIRDLLFGNVWLYE